jgi:hypothetical protein
MRIVEVERKKKKEEIRNKFSTKCEERKKRKKWRRPKNIFLFHF